MPTNPRPAARRFATTLAAIATALLAIPAAASAATCPTTIPSGAISAAQLRDLSARYVADGLYRTPGTTAHERSVAWLKRELQATPGVRVTETRKAASRWQPDARAADGGGDLSSASTLQVRRGGRWRTVPTAGAIPYTLPTGRDGVGGQLQVIGKTEPITAAKAKGRILVLDVPDGSVPQVAFAALASYLTPDLLQTLTGTFARPYLATDSPLAKRLVDAGRAGASGVVVAFGVPRSQVAGYWDPHTGVNFTVPAAFAGADEAKQLRALAAEGGAARVAVHAKRDTSTSPTLVADLDGAQRHRTILQSHTDGVTWIQDNGPVAILALVKYFATLPQSCRPSLEAILSSGHLIQSEGQNAVEEQAERVEHEFDAGRAGAVLTMEHLGSKEIEAFPRTDGGPGKSLRYTGRAEQSAISVTESPQLTAAFATAVARSGIDRTAVLRGTSLPSATLPTNCSPGGDNTAFWQKALPAAQAISGPWSLFDPVFGEQAVDFGRMLKQTRIFGDVVLQVAPTDPRVLAGPTLLAYRGLRGSGLPGCKEYAAGDPRNSFTPRDQAPGPGADLLRVTGHVATRLRLAKRPTVTCRVRGGAGTRTCLAQAIVSARSKRTGKLRPKVVARGTATVPRSGTATIELRPTRYGRRIARRVPRRGRNTRIVVVARDGYDVTEQQKLRAKIGRR